MAFDSLERFLGGNSSKQQNYSDFLARLQQNPQSISDVEVEDRYRELLRHASPDAVAEAYQHVVGQLAPEQRHQLAEAYQQAQEDPNSPFDGYQFASLRKAAEPHSLGLMAQQAATQDPDLFDQLFGPNSPLNGPLGRLVLAGVAAYLANRVLNQQPGQAGQVGQQPTTQQPTSSIPGLPGGLIGAIGGLIGAISKQQQGGQAPSIPGGLGGILDVLNQSQQQGGQGQGIPGGLGGILDILTGGQQQSGAGLPSQAPSQAPSQSSTPGIHIKGSKTDQ